MGRLALAWRVLTSGELAARISDFLNAPAALPSRTPAPKAVQPPEPAKPTQNASVSLLAALQREGRLIDFLKESIDGYSDAQIGAAVRDIHRDCAAVLERQFAIRPVLNQAEGSSVELGGKSFAGRIRLTGNAGVANPASGSLVHHGWHATKCELPVWTGDSQTTLVIAPAEVEIR